MTVGRVLVLIQVASYAYDVWGNITNGGSSGVGLENPFRYRGYYYDNETGFYYLQSRYYDPEICRFICADNLELLPALSQTAGQLNLYAYCNNNPIMYSDPSGEILLSTAILIGMGIGAAVGVGVGIGIGLANGASGWELFADAMLGMGLGGLLGAAIGAAIFYAPTIAGGISNFFNSSFAIGSFAMGDQLVAVSVTGAQIAAAAGISAIGLNILFKSDSRPRNNSVQDKQFRDAARKAGVDPKDPKIRDELNLAHMYIRNNHLNLGFKDLVEFIRTWFGLG